MFQKNIADSVIVNLVTNLCSFKKTINKDCKTPYGWVGISPSREIRNDHLQKNIIVTVECPVELVKNLQSFS